MTKKFTKALALILAAICVLSAALVGSAASYISADAAKQAAVNAVNAKFGTSYAVADVTFEDRFYSAEYDDDYRCAVYDISFFVKNANGTYTEYDVDIDAVTGATKGYIDSEIENRAPAVGSPDFLAYLKGLIESFINYLKSLLGIA